MDAQWMLKGCSMEAHWLHLPLSPFSRSAIFLRNKLFGITFKNPLQRYKNILGYANFWTQKVKFFDENLHISEKSSNFAAQN